MKKWILASLAILIVIPVALYLALPFLASKAVESWLSEQGFDDPHFDVAYPTNRELLIKQLEVTKNTPDRHSTLKAGPVTLHYRPLTLLFSGTFERITIPEASLVISTKDLNQSENIANTEASAFAVELANFLPSFWIEQTPAAEILIGQLTTTLQLGSRPDIKLVGNIALQNQQLFSRVEGYYDAQPLARADLHFTANDRFSFSLLHDNQSVIDVEGRAVEDEKAILIAANHETNLAKAHELLWQIPGSIAQIIPGFTGALKGRAKISLQRTLTQDTTAWLQALSFEDSSKTNIVALSPLETIKVVNLNIETETQLTNDKGLQVQVTPKSKITALNLGNNDWHIDKLDFTTQSPITVNYFDKLTVSPFRISLAYKDAQFGVMTLASEPIELDIQSVNAAKQTFSAGYTLKELKVQLGKDPIPPFFAKGLFTFTPDTLKTSYFFVNEPLDIDLSGDLSYVINNKLLKTNWHLKEIPTNELPLKWRNYLPFKWPIDIQIGEGFYSQNGALSWWDGTLDGKINHLMRDLHVMYQKVAIEGINAKSTTFLRDKRIDEQGTLTVKQVEQGYSLQKLNAEYRINQLTSKDPIININALQAELLGGTLTATPFYTTFNDMNIRTDIEVSELSLNQLLQLENQPGLTGQGLLSGRIPLTYHQGKLAVKAGDIKAVQPGNIRYEPTDNVRQMGQNNQGLGIALKALSNFNYTTLSANANYQSNGDLLLQTQLSGSNPDWNKGQPVNFSINIEENLIQLMKSLQFADKLAEQLQHKKQ